MTATYESLLETVMMEGNDREDRTGVGTRSVFGAQLRFDLENSFPLITTKKVHFKSIVHELLWMIAGDTNIKYLNDNGVHIWDEWADENGDLGPVYGRQWRDWIHHEVDYSNQSVYSTKIDQLGLAIDTIKRYPDSRRIIVNSWNVGEVQEMALPPCHMMFQFYVEGDKLSCQLYQRSADLFLGVPFNIASYALLTYMVADVTGLKPGEFIWTGGDCHIYHNHFDQVQQQLGRETLPFPQLKLKHRNIIDAFTYEDVQLVNYQSHPAIKADVAV